MLDHLVEANLAKSVRHVMQVRRILAIVASGYREILRNGLPQLDVA
jgi:flagellin-specific chaperone FliS